MLGLLPPKHLQDEKTKNGRVTQQYDNGDSGYQANSFSYKEISSIFTGREVAQAKAV